MESQEDLRKKIIHVINNDISPKIKAHGGFIKFKSLKDGVVTITLGGNCNGCISAQITAEKIVKEKLKEKLGDEIRGVKVYQDIDDQIWDFAKELLRGKENELER